MQQCECEYNDMQYHIEYNLDTILLILVAFRMQNAMQLKPQIFFPAITFSTIRILYKFIIWARNPVNVNSTMPGAVSLWIQSRCNSFHSRCIMNAKVADIATTFNTVTISETNSRWACNTVNVNTTMFHIEYNFDPILSIPVAFWMQCNWSHKYSHYKNSCFLLKLPKLWLQ